MQRTCRHKFFTSDIILLLNIYCFSGEFYVRVSMIVFRRLWCIAANILDLTDFVKCFGGFSDEKRHVNLCKTFVEFFFGIIFPWFMKLSSRDCVRSLLINFINSINHSTDVFNDFLLNNKLQINITKNWKFVQMFEDFIVLKTEMGNL